MQQQGQPRAHHSVPEQMEPQREQQASQRGQLSAPGEPLAWQVSLPH
jgi:hypothetical protein